MKDDVVKVQGIGGAELLRIGGIDLGDAGHLPVPRRLVPLGKVLRRLILVLGVADGGQDALGLESLFVQRVKGKCILASNAQANVKVRKDEIEVNAIASYGQMKISVVTKAAVTEPEKHIRDMQRLKEK